MIDEQTVFVKADLMESGIGSIPARRLWESQPGEYGDFVHLALTDDGRYAFSITDMEEHHGSYSTVYVEPIDLLNLRAFLDGSHELNDVDLSQATQDLNELKMLVTMAVGSTITDRFMMDQQLIEWLNDHSEDGR